MVLLQAKAWPIKEEMEPGITTIIPIALAVNLVDIEWSVTPVVIEDRYDITVEQTFATKVPALVVVIDPVFSQLPSLSPGEVYYGEFTITNHGLISADNLRLESPGEVGDFEVEVFTDGLPAKLEALQSVTVAYRVTRKIISDTEQVASASSDCEEVQGYGGNYCAATIKLTAKYDVILCPNTIYSRAYEETRVKSISIPLKCGEDEDEFLKEVEEKYGVHFDVTVDFYENLDKPSTFTGFYGVQLSPCHTCKELEAYWGKWTDTGSYPVYRSKLDSTTKAALECLEREVGKSNVEVNSAWRKKEYQFHIYYVYWMKVALDELEWKYGDIYDFKGRCPKYWKKVLDEYRYHSPIGRVAWPPRSAHVGGSKNEEASAFDANIRGVGGDELEAVLDTCKLKRRYAGESWHYEPR